MAAPSNGASTAVPRRIAADEGREYILHDEQKEAVRHAEQTVKPVQEAPRHSEDNSALNFTFDVIEEGGLLQLIFISFQIKSYILA
jgi:hypothetical protein